MDETTGAGAARPSRRTVLRAAALTPAVLTPAVLIPASTGTGTAHADPQRAGTGAADASFVLAVVPDTQYLFDAPSIDPAPLRETFRHVVREHRSQQIAFLAHLGDVVENARADEIDAAAETFRALAGTPHSVIAGNHDVNGRTDDQRGDTPFRRAFGPDHQAGMPTYRGSCPGGYNSAHVFSGGGREWLLLALDWRISEIGLAWAQGVLDAHPTLPAIVTSHEFVAPDGVDGGAAPSVYGRTLWDRLIRRNDQVFLVLGGHFWPSGVTVLTNDAGNPVHAHCVNYQDRYYGGAGMLRTYTVDPARRVVDVDTVAPWVQAQPAARRPAPAAEIAELSGPADRFSFPLDPDVRFAGFAPPTGPAPRPARAVLVRDTVGYWRFDAEGSAALAALGDGAPVPDGVVVRDLSGGGNDLTVARLGGSPADVLTVSTDHHRGAPGHASMRFDGARPSRAAILRAGDRAPINAMAFERGYTIETFLRLPEPLIGDHAFMGVLSWESTAAEAGKSGGYSPQECTVSLNVSGERFLQFVVYPRNLDDDPTNWSHAIPTGRWTHVAIVNDRRRTVLYVDGTPVVRNPRTTSTGIATVGRPFVLGATSFGLRYGQGFCGSLGDTRVVARALRPAEFLAPA